jgi:iron complex transport system permease protein
MIVVDDIARCLPGRELPVGLITALIGTPAFAVLLWKNGGRGCSLG